MKRLSHASRRQSSGLVRAKPTDNHTTLDTVVEPQTRRKVTRRRLSSRTSVKRLRHTISSSLPDMRARKMTLDTIEHNVDVLTHSDEMNGRSGVQSLPGRPSGHRCKICGTHFDRLELLKAHLCEHGGERPFPCFICNLRFTTKWNLLKHQKCRAHRAAQTRAINNGLDKSNSLKPLSIRKRRTDWTPRRLSCRIERGNNGRDSLSSKKTLNLYALPSDTPSVVSPVGQTNPLIPNSEPTTIWGTLSLELSKHRTVTIPVSLNYEDVKSCIASMDTDFETYITGSPVDNSEKARTFASYRQQEILSNSLSCPDPPKYDEQTISDDNCRLSSWTHKLRTSQQEHVSLHPIRSFNSERSISSTISVHCTSGCPSSPTIINSRTQEEIQAARTILSLANSGAVPAFLQHSDSSCCDTDPKPCQSDSSKCSDDLKTTDPQVFEMTQRMSTLDYSVGFSSSFFHSSTAPSPSVSVVPSVQNPCQADAVPRCTGTDFPPVLKNDLHPCRRSEICEPFSSSASPTDKIGQPSRPAQLHPISPVPTRLPKAHTSIRPPPKKRLSLHYQRNAAAMFESSNSCQPIPDVHTSLILTTTSTTAVVNTHLLSPAKTTSIDLTPVALCPTSTMIKAPVPTSGILAWATPGRCQLDRTSLLSSSTETPATHSQTSPLTTSSPIQYSNSSAPQNVVILPQFMLLPRVISSYIPMTPGSGMVTSCFLVQPECAVRSSTMNSTVTDSLVTPIPTTMCAPTPVTCVKPTTVDSCPTTTTTIISPHVSPTGSKSMSFFICGGNSSVSSEAGHLDTVQTDPLTKPGTVDLALHSSSKHLSTAEAASPLSLPNSTVVLNPDSQRTIQVQPSTSVQNRRTETTTSRLVSILPAGSRPCRNQQPLQSRIKPLPQDASSGAARLFTSRSKYRCHECGLACPKPCLLRKHYRTHSNVRPYLCQHCDVSFKTRGNLSKHMKSRGHHDRCARELGLVQPPLVVDDDTQVDRQALERQRQLMSSKEAVKRDIWRSRFRAIQARSTGRVSLLGGKLSASLRLKSKRRVRKHTKCSRNREVANTEDHEPPLLSKAAESGPDKIPAPNVNAVHLLQDLPLNLSVHPRQPAFAAPYSTASLGQPKWAPLSAHCSQSNALSPTNWSLPVLSTCFPSKLDMTEAEEIVRTAVAAARTLNNGVGNSGVAQDDLQGDKSHFSVSDTSIFSQTTSSPTGNSVTCDLKTFSVQGDSVSHSLTPQSTSNCIRKSPILSDGNRRTAWKVQPASVDSSNNPAFFGGTPSDSSLKKLDRSPVGSAKRRITNPESPVLKKGLVEIDGEQRQVGDGLKNSGINGTNAHTTTSNNSRLRDPRPYKCGACRIGFRVPGHLHKHYRAKSHLVTVLQSHNLPSDMIEQVRQSRIGVSQVINPGSGQLRPRCIERLLAMKPQNALNAAGSDPVLSDRPK